MGEREKIDYIKAFFDGLRNARLADCGAMTKRTTTGTMVG
jgi:hypothetical protein